MLKFKYSPQLDKVNLFFVMYRIHFSLVLFNVSEDTVGNKLYNSVLLNHTNLVA